MVGLQVIESFNGGLELPSVNASQQKVDRIVKLFPDKRLWQVLALLHVATGLDT